MRELLEKADRFELSSLAPDRDDRTEDFPVLGTIEIRDPATRRELVNALSLAIDPGTPAVKCFRPRHRITAQRGTETLVLTICFECQSLEMGPTLKRTKSRGIASAPQAAFDAALTRGGITPSP